MANCQTELVRLYHIACVHCYDRRWIWCIIKNDRVSDLLFVFPVNKSPGRPVSSGVCLFLAVGHSVLGGKVHEVEFCETFRMKCQWDTSGWVAFLATWVKVLSVSSDSLCYTSHTVSPNPFFTKHTTSQGFLHAFMRVKQREAACES